MAESSKALLDQTLGKPSVLEILLLNSSSQSGNQRGNQGGPLTTSVSQSQVLGKVKDFLGVIAKANEELELDSKEKSRADYDIEVLNGNEKEYIEMDLLLGVADLHTSEALAAAEVTMNGFPPSRTSYVSSSPDTEEDDDDDDDDDDEIGDTSDDKLEHGSNRLSSEGNKPSYKGKLKKKPKIIVLDQSSGKGCSENGV